MNEHQLQSEFEKFKLQIPQLIAVALANINNRTHFKTKEACEFLSCSPNTLNAICIQYQIYPKKISGSNYYSKSDLERVFGYN